MLLLLTHSHDFTTDDVCARLPADMTVFRFNIDLWTHYRWEIGPETFLLEDPTGRVCRESEVRAVYLRKLFFNPPFIDIPMGGSEEQWRREEITQVWLGLRDWAHETGRLALVKPSSTGRWNKIRQMKVARKFFPVTDWRIFHGAVGGLSGPVVVKTLGAQNTGGGGIVSVREIDPSRLSPDYPWFIQTKLSNATHDVTVAWVAGKQFAYETSREYFEGEDVRFSNSGLRGELPWNPVKLSEEDNERIAAFMVYTGMDFGRLDFLKIDGQLWFLEVNPNGQFAWLDPNGENGLLDAVAGAIHEVWLRNEIPPISGVPVKELG